MTPNEQARKLQTYLARASERDLAGDAAARDRLIREAVEAVSLPLTAIHDAVAAKFGAGLARLVHVPQ